MCMLIYMHVHMHTCTCAQASRCGGSTTHTCMCMLIYMHVHTCTYAGVPLRRFDNARSEIETFGDVASFLADVAMAKLVAVRDLSSLLPALTRCEGWRSTRLVEAAGGHVHAHP